MRHSLGLGLIDPLEKGLVVGQALREPERDLALGALHRIRACRAGTRKLQGCLKALAAPSNGILAKLTRQIRVCRSAMLCGLLENSYTQSSILRYSRL